MKLRSPGIAGLDFHERMQVETLEEIAERLSWSPERLDEARMQLAESRPSNTSERDLARAKALSESISQTRQALDEAS